MNKLLKKAIKKIKENKVLTRKEIGVCLMALAIEKRRR